jgi:hypothetical protein
MPAVLGSYFPTAGFAAPRSYIEQIDFALYGDRLDHGSSTWIVSTGTSDPTFIVCEWLPDWYVWNSKTFLISEIVKNFYYEVPPSIVQHPLAFDLGFWLNPTTKKPGLFLNWFTGPRLPAIVNLSPSPPSYWLPRPL